MHQLFDTARRSLVATLCATALLSGSALAAGLDRTSPPQLLAQATSPAPAPAQPKAAPAKPRHSPTDRVEARITRLHGELKITAAQELQWNAVAQAMRDDAKAMEQAIEQRRQAKSMTAVDDLKSYQAIADAHAQGLQKLIPAFQALYDSMSDEQKKNADAVFSQSHRRARMHKKSAAPKAQ